MSIDCRDYKKVSLDEWFGIRNASKKEDSRSGPEKHGGKFCIHIKGRLERQRLRIQLP